MIAFGGHPRRGPALLFGHRGAPGTGLKENTIESFRRALQDGATALETDAHLTRDGHVVLSHDPDLSRVLGAGIVIKDSTLDEVRALGVPTLRELLDFAPHVPINVDIKQRTPPMEQALIEAIGDDAPRVLLASFHADALARVRALGYRGPTGLSADEVRRLFLPRLALRVVPRLLTGARAQIPLRSGRIRLDTKTLIEKCHALGIAVDYWTVNDVDTARRLLDLGADGIMSDDPGRIKTAWAGSS
jgi:glycerophosphoryl diester phosphodiesterase